MDASDRSSAVGIEGGGICGALASSLVSTAMARWSSDARISAADAVVTAENRVVRWAISMWGREAFGSSRTPRVGRFSCRAHQRGSSGSSSLTDSQRLSEIRDSRPVPMGWNIWFRHRGTARPAPRRTSTLATWSFWRGDETVSPVAVDQRGDATVTPARCRRHDRRIGSPAQPTGGQWANL